MKFNENQIKAINHFEGNCCVLASAGSGKTSVLINRIKNLVDIHDISHENILAITFSKKAADNMKNRLGDLYSNVQICTFHAMGYKILFELGLIKDFKIIQEWEKKKYIIDSCIKTLNLELYEEDVSYNSILNFISYQKNHIINVGEQLSPVVDMPYDLNKMGDLYELYEQLKNNNNRIDFDDMLLTTYNILLNRDKIRRKFSDRFKFILIDEMQDTNKLQYEIIKLLGNVNNNVYVVGDPLQCVYEWRLADNNYLINFNKDWMDTTVINLNTNYRSTKNIVEFANKLVKDTKETSHEFYVESIANKKQFKDPQFLYSIDEKHEGKNIAQKINKHVDGKKYKYSDFCILSRTNFQMQAIEQALYSNKIPYECVDGTSFFDQKEIKDMIAFIRLAHNTEDDDAFIRIYNTPNRYLGKVMLDEVSVYAKKKKMSLFDSMLNFPRAYEWRYGRGIKELHHLITKIRLRKRYNVGDLITIIRKDLKYDAYISKEISENNDKCEKTENLNVLVNMARDFNNMKDFLNEIETISKQQVVTQDDDRVKIMTIHKSKGLEFPVVFVAGVNQNILPHFKSDNVSEEKRLLYVAMTRAEKELFLSSVNFYQDKRLKVSDFLYDIFPKTMIEKTLKNKTPK